VTVWIDWLGTASAEIDTSQHHLGTKSAEFYIDYGNSVFASYSDYRPSYRGFWLKTDGYVRPTTATGDWQHDIFVRVNGATLQYFYNWGWQSTSCSLSSYTWHFIEFKDIDWGNGKYSIYVDDKYVQRVDMCPDMGFSGITQYYSCEYAGSFWVDDINAPSSTGVSCPVTMLFYHNAEIDKVKLIYLSMLPIVGTDDWALLNDGNGWIWDSDRGVKWGCYFPGVGSVFAHLRLYAPNPRDYMENSAWGKYVLGTTHFDDFPDEDWFGYNEYAEDYFADLTSLLGYAVFEDWSSFYNYEPDREEPIISPVSCEPDFYYWQNDGNATAVYVP
jgi:hypothetical protein